MSSRAKQHRRRAEPRLKELGTRVGPAGPGKSAYVLRLTWPEGLNGRDEIDFSKLQLTLEVGRDLVWFRFPDPYGDLTIRHGEVLSRRKAEAIYALAHVYGAVRAMKFDG